jgi:UDP-N-acetylglucosamine 3-dehydrogenase
MIALWRRAAGLLLHGDYYPHTPSHRSPREWVAWQFDAPEAGCGLLQGIRLAECPQETLTLYPAGLCAEATYRLENAETGEARETSGDDLLREGFALALPPRSGAIWFYRKLERGGWGHALNVHKSVRQGDGMSKLRIGVIGPGIIWQRAHRPALAPYGEQVAFTAFCASSERRRAEVERDHPGAPFFLDYRELIASPDVDWVLVLTPIALNAPVALAAMRAGKHVFLEKPMARTLAEAEALLRVADEGDRRLFVLEQFVYATYLDALEEVLRSGEIGEVLTYDQVVYERYDAQSFDAPGWRTEADFPLGRLFDGGHHPIARNSRLFGRPASVYATGCKVRPNYGEYDHLLALFEYDTRLRGSFSHGSVFDGRKNHFYIYGTEGMIALERDRFVVERYDGSGRMVPYARERDYAAMWRALLAAIAEGREPYYTQERAFQDLSILLAIQRSAQERAVVRL